MIHSIQEFAAKMILSPFDLLVSKFTPNKSILAADDVPFTDLLINNRSVFFNEYMNIVKNKNINDIKNFYKIKKNFNEDDKWKAVPLILFSYMFKENVSRCPQTFELVKKIPGCCAAMFSVLEPGKHIPPHKGIYKGIYRCLFTIKLEEDAVCWIRVNNEKVDFKEGSIIVFDETVEHEVMNASNSSRVALYLDIYRKLPFPLNLYNRFIYFIIMKSPFVQNILSEYKKLETVTVLPFKPSKSDIL
jgi:beta-hydroxylase